MARDSQVLEDKEAELESSKPELRIPPKGLQHWMVAAWIKQPGPEAGERTGPGAKVDGVGSTGGQLLSAPWGSRLILSTPSPKIFSTGA